MFTNAKGHSRKQIISTYSKNKLFFFYLAKYRKQLQTDKAKNDKNTYF
jgi:hypothetical protein